MVRIRAGAGSRVGHPCPARVAFSRLCGIARPRLPRPAWPVSTLTEPGWFIRNRFFKQIEGIAPYWENLSTLRAIKTMVVVPCCISQQLSLTRARIVAISQPSPRSIAFVIFARGLGKSTRNDRGKPPPARARGNERGHRRHRPVLSLEIQAGARDADVPGHHAEVGTGKDALAIFMQVVGPNIDSPRFRDRHKPPDCPRASCTLPEPRMPRNFFATVPDKRFAKGNNLWNAENLDRKRR